MCNTIFVSNATTTDTGIILIPNRTIKALTNCGCYRLVICCNATATSNEPVFMQTTAGNIPVLCKAGNTMYANMLQKRRNYSIMYGNDNENYIIGQFVVQDRVCPKSTPIGTTTTTDETSDDTNNSVIDPTRKK